jgi:1,4-dihydroxy-2-naphthoyl-CoA synthase
MKDIKYDVDEHKATITLNRPDALNALSPHMISELRAAYDEAEDDDNIWLLIVTGAGRRDVLRLPCQRGPGVRTRAHRPDAAGRPGRDIANRVDGQR